MEEQSVTTAKATLTEPQGSSSQQNDGGKDDANRKKTSTRKRTKTGCLTCRRRRIKCDEGRPICHNCIKSRRDCEGYSQRVIFKEPLGSFSSPFNQAIFSGPSNIVDESLPAHRQSSRGLFPAIAPRPPNFDQHQHGLPFQPTSAPYQQQFHRGPVLQDPAAYSMGSGQFLQSPYNPQFPNPLLATEAIGGPGYFTRPPPEAQFFSLQDGSSAGDMLGNFGNLGGNHPLNVHTGTTVTQPLNNHWEFDMLDDEASLPDSDDDLPDVRGNLPPIKNLVPERWTVSPVDISVFSAFAQSDDVQAHMETPYSSEFWASGLNTIFMHFINVTGPGISIFEGDISSALDRSRMKATAGSGKSLWSYAIPSLALQHLGLFHAMLALASLQLAKLRDSPPTAALRHYHRAIRRIAKSVKSPSKRTQPATLAATLLLSYFEVWSSDHTKWCNHLFGARILFREMSLGEMTRTCFPAKRMRQRQDARGYQLGHIGSYIYGPHCYPASSHSAQQSLDYDFLNVITGLTLSPEAYGDVEGQLPDAKYSSVTDKEIEKYDIICDLFWWYCKMDVYQSILGGTKLFMEYDNWTQIPPRAPFSTYSSAYGTYDHLVLLLGRLSDFVSKDLSRKQKAIEAKGENAGTGSPPMFPGMFPTFGKVQAPMGFSPPRDGTPHSDSQDELDPEATYEAALQEWNAIYSSFEVFKSRLGPEFQPLGDEPDGPRRTKTPFGDPIYFRTYSIAGIWMNYYMGFIHLYRSHPSMPPVAMRAAGLMAKKTAGFALKIGQIASGLAADCSEYAVINTYLGAALIESSFCVFVAGVQYNETRQREWVIQRMHDIARLTGWQSAMQIACGCESAWIKSSTMGGPEYTRPTIINNVPSTIWKNPRRIDKKIDESESGEERRLVLAKAERTHYAIGILAIETELARLELRDDLN
ncbi:Zn(2)-C6 fungal-type domain-containing protein [Trichoderma simmonsii]|uniref:Zn(2)-C6 fungal-type domain-containing protein n=1 Tax=Trichoderma simmonsii TaxID=1491479 RepID=A0A8G0PED7_9HYPO|nr:Zn(2)-C6 fungal-type domain-containing protein [Trichoderma simmonsii]